MLVGIAPSRSVITCFVFGLFLIPDSNGTVQIWNLKTYKLHTDLPGHTDEVYCVDFVTDKIVSGGRDATVKMAPRAQSLLSRASTCG